MHVNGYSYSETLSSLIHDRLTLSVALTCANNRGIINLSPLGRSYDRFVGDATLRHGGEVDLYVYIERTGLVGIKPHDGNFFVVHVVLKPYAMNI